MILIPTLRRLFRATAVVLAFLIGVLITSTLPFLLSPLAPKKANRILKSFVQAWCKNVRSALGVRIRQQGVSPMDTPGLIVSNHISWLDIIVLGSTGPFAFVSKYEVAEWPVVGYLAIQAGTLFLRRGDRESTRAVCSDMTARLTGGDHLVFFPEGTSSPGTSVLRFHARLFQAALDAGVEVQAVGIAYRNEAGTVVPFVGDDEFLPHLWRVMALPRIEVDLFFCEPLPTEALDRKKLSELTYQQIVTALKP